MYRRALSTGSAVCMELLREPMTTMPTQKILDRLRVCYDSTAASWNWRDPNGAFGMIFTPKDIVLARRRGTHARPAPS